MSRPLPATPFPLAIGIAGWSYPDWKGVVHEPGCRDVLHHVASYVDVIEINSTFYRIPRCKDVEAWVRRTSDLPVFFTAKIPSPFTHGDGGDPTMVSATRSGFSPLVEASRLKALLLQFSHHVRAEDSTFRRIASLVSCFGDLAPTVVEVRHPSFGDQAASRRLRDLGVGVVQLDYPGMQGGFAGGESAIPSPEGLLYFRAHGRNADAWFARDAGRDAVYNHEYTPSEVVQIQDRLTTLSACAKLTVVIANNHFHGKAMKLVFELLAWLRGGPVEVPDPMLRHYPSLEAIAVRRRRSLFDGPRGPSA